MILILFTTRAPSTLADELARKGHEVYDALAISEVMALAEQHPDSSIVIAPEVNQERASIIQQHWPTIRLHSQFNPMRMFQLVGLSLKCRHGIESPMCHDLTAKITEEIAYAIRKLGGDPSPLDLTDTWKVNRTLEFLGASIYLKAAIGSWRDTLTDEEVLDDLRRWRVGGNDALRPDISFVN